jgi:hypothetical protein
MRPDADSLEALRDSSLARSANPAVPDSGAPRSEVARPGKVRESWFRGGIADRVGGSMVVCCRLRQRPGHDYPERWTMTSGLAHSNPDLDGPMLRALEFLETIQQLTGERG